MADNSDVFCGYVSSSQCYFYLIFRKDPHGFFAFPVTDQIAPGYFMIIKHPMDFSTMKDKIAANEYKSITEFKVCESLVIIICRLYAAHI